MPNSVLETWGDFTETIFMSAFKGWAGIDQVGMENGFAIVAGRVCARYRVERRARCLGSGKSVTYLISATLMSKLLRTSGSQFSYGQTYILIVHLQER